MTKPQLAIVRILFKYTGLCCPRLAARWGIHLWGKTSRPAWRDWEHKILSTARAEVLPGKHANISTYCWGDDRKKVLLLPGWNSRASHFRSFIERLSSAGYQVVGMDPPGHGQSSGNGTNIRQYLDSIREVHEYYGSFHAVIGHSFGGFCIPFALSRFPLANRAILLATPISLHWLFDRFCNIIHAHPAIREHMKLEVKHLLGNDCWQNFDIVLQAKSLYEIPALILHDENDVGVPLDHARLINASWPGSHLILTKGLGHQRVLRHPDSVKPAIEFVQQD